jgi:hypothetical protein
VDVRHAIVGSAVELAGEADGALLVPPDEIPACDVLELDCEGAEVEVLTSLRITPRAILVETHGMLGAPTERVRGILTASGYEIVEEVIAETMLAEFCAANDVRVLVALRQPAP